VIQNKTGFPVPSRGRFPGAPGTATAAEKILSVSRELGVEGMEIMQATTRTIYDSLPMNGTTVFKFFEGCNARAFPNTNLPANRLEVGEAMAVEYLTLQVMTQAVLGTITATAALSTLATGAYFASDFSLNIANQVVVKPISMGQLNPLFNKDGKFATNECFRFSSYVIIPALQQFVATWRTSVVTVVANTYIKCTLEGWGAIFNPKRPL